MLPWLAALAIEWLRSKGGTAGDQALALVFYTGIALGVAAGATFRTTGRRRTRPGRAIIAAHRRAAQRLCIEITESVALHDLEIRGAGNILGAEQSGHIAAVGFELYVELLNEAVAELSGTRHVAPRPIRVAP